MNKLIFTKYNDRTMAFLLSGNRLIQAEADTEDARDTIGTVFLGKVKNIVKNLNAAFIEYCPGVNGYYSLDDSRYAPISQPLRPGDEIPVQLSRAAVKTKDAVLSSRLELAGEYAVLMLDEPSLGISSKIQDKEWREGARLRWEQLEESERVFRLVIRTNGYNAGFEKIWEEYRELTGQMKKILASAASRTCYSVLYRPESFAIKSVKNIYSSETEEILTDLPEIYEELTGKGEQKTCFGLPVRLYTDTAISLSALYSIPSALDRAFKRIVWLPSGGSLVLEPTEALTVVDVNSGKNIKKLSPEELAFMTNMEAAREIAAQIRLRNYSGIILVDFINMKEQKRRSELLDSFRRFLSKDPVKTVLVDMTPLGLVEVTRKKIKEPLRQQLD